jgi:hypothetical protein
MATLSSLIQNYTSTETLDSVADRGATTNQSLTMGNLTSTGIDDNATSTAITIDASQNVTVGGNFSATKLTALNGTLELDDNGTHNGIINVPASLFINIDSDNTNTGEDFVIAKDRTSASGGTELFRVQEDGTVGIGVTNPSGATLEIQSNSGANALKLRARTNDDYSFIQFYDNAGSTLRGQIGNHNGDFNFYTGSSGTIRAKLNTSGHLAIGNTNATYILDVDAGAPASSDQVLGRFSSQNGIRDIGFVWDDSASTLGIATLTNHALTFHTNGNSSERMRIAADGKVGIGRTPTDVGLEVFGPAYTGFDGPASIFIYGDANYNDAGNAGSGILFGGKYTSAGTLSTFALISGIKENTNNTNYAGALTFQTRPMGSTPVERMRIDSVGNVGINTTPAGWQSSSTTLDISDATALWNFSLGANRQTNLLHNLYYDGSFKTKVTDGYGSMHIVSAGQDDPAIFVFYAGNGTANQAVSLNQIAKLDEDGLRFGTDTAVANALDDYEEGTFTPSFTTGGTLTVNSATYTKIGRQVTCRFHLTASTTCTGDITGLPFTPNGESGGVVGYQTHVASETIGILVQAANVWNLRIGQTQYGLAAGKQIRGMFSYFTDS